MVQPQYLEFAFPSCWLYDVLRALDYFRGSGADPDPRTPEAVEVVQSKRQPDGRWLLDRIHPGRVYFDFAAARHAEPLEHPPRASVLNCWDVVPPLGEHCPLVCLWLPHRLLAGPTTSPTVLSPAHIGRNHVEPLMATGGDGPVALARAPTPGRIAPSRPRNRARHVRVLRQRVRPAPPNPVGRSWPCSRSPRMPSLRSAV